MSQKIKYSICSAQQTPDKDSLLFKMIKHQLLLSLGKNLIKPELLLGIDHIPTYSLIDASASLDRVYMAGEKNLKCDVNYAFVSLPV